MNLDTLINGTSFAHSQQVSKISALLASKAGYQPNDVSVIEQAALYHDIGKLSIPAAILSKPGALTPEEYAIVKTHTDEGAKQLHEMARVLSIASQIALEHHERCDGSGYMHLRGNEMHPFSKLISVVDVFDALYSRRSYKEAWDIIMIRDFFEKQAEQFDPYIVSLLFRNLDSILNLYQAENV